MPVTGHARCTWHGLAAGRGRFHTLWVPPVWKGWAPGSGASSAAGWSFHPAAVLMTEGLAPVDAAVPNAVAMGLLLD